MDSEAKRRELQEAARKFWAEAKPYIAELRALGYTEPQATDKAKQRWRALWKPIESATQEAEGTLAKWEAALSDDTAPFERKVGRYGGQWWGRARAKTAAELAAEVTAAQPEIAARAREARAVLAILANARKARERADAEGAKADAGPRGVTLRHVAEILQKGDLDETEKMLTRWNKSHIKKPQAIGLCPSDRRAKLYEPTAIAQWAAKVQDYLTVPEDKLIPRLMRLAVPAWGR